jgi:hypothetical protein
MRPMISPSMLLIALLAVLAMGMTACRATEEVKQGYAGEHCNGVDLDCRPGYLCDRSVCRAELEQTGVTCETMCRRLEICETNEENCLAKCRNTIREWSPEAIEAFGECIISGLTCEEARTVVAHQVCYERIPIVDGRRDRCTYFVEAARSCDNTVNTLKLRDECLYMARTRSQQVWTRTDACVERVEDGFCDEIADCFNEVFQLEPPLAL